MWIILNNNQGQVNKKTWRDAAATWTYDYAFLPYKAYNIEFDSRISKASKYLYCNFSQ